MPQINPFVQSELYTSRPQPNRQRENVQTVNATNERSQQNLQTENPRVVKVAPPGVAIQQLENRERFSTLNQSSSNQPPIAQYQFNQQLLKREEIDSLIGIDLFA